MYSSNYVIDEMAANCQGSGCMALVKTEPFGGRCDALPQKKPCVTVCHEMPMRLPKLLKASPPSK